MRTRAAVERGGPILVTVRLWVRLWTAPGGEAAFRRFEDAAFAAMARYGAAPEVEHGPGDGGPDEVRRFRVPSPGAFAGYRADPGMARLAPLRAEAVARTKVDVEPAD
ncbi:MAG: hypothetical protein AAF322_17790 [Pseudomonadota bacterium]